MKAVIKDFEKGIKIKYSQADSQWGDHEIAIQDMASFSAAHLFLFHVTRSLHDGKSTKQTAIL